MEEKQPQPFSRGLYRAAPWYAGISLVAGVTLTLLYHPPLAPAVLMFVTGLAMMVLYVAGDLTGRKWVKTWGSALVMAGSMEFRFWFLPHSDFSLNDFSWYFAGLGIPLLVFRKKMLAVHDGMVSSDSPSISN